MKSILSSAMLIAFTLITSAAVAENSTKTKADNSAVNARDTKALTADEQSKGSDRDVEITRQIRKSVVDQKELSTYAKNVKIITVGGKVVLRGPVNSEAEKNIVKQQADKIAGSQNVKNELEVVNQ